MAINYFTVQGYTVSLPINDTQWYDLIVEKDNKFYTVQCKATGSSDNSISLNSTGGTKGSAYDSILNHPVDYLFCLDKNLNMYVIPVEKIKEAGNTKSITLRTEKSIYSNKNSFDTSLYLVSL